MSCSCTVSREFCPMHGDDERDMRLADVPEPVSAQQIRSGVVREHVSAASDAGREGPSVAASRKLVRAALVALLALDRRLAADEDVERERRRSGAAGGAGVVPIGRKVGRS